METRGPKGDVKRFALIALLVFVLDKAVTSSLHILKYRVYSLEDIPTIPLTGVLFYWVVPFLIAYKVEGRDRKSLGLTIPREKRLPYALYAVVAFILPGVFVGIDRSLVVEFIEQIVYIGLAEEVFFRGYLMTRLSDWLGDGKGLFLSSLLFGLGHIISLVSQHGLEYPLHDAFVGFYTSLGGLLFGYLYLRAKNIVPPALIHVAANMYLFRIMEVL